jgi:hypothetical protein
MLSLLIHVTVVPVFTVSVEGVNEKLCMLTVVPSAGDVSEVGTVDVVCDDGVYTLEALLDMK